MSAETVRPEDADELRAEREEDAVETTEAAPRGLDAEDLEAEEFDREQARAEDDGLAQVDAEDEEAEAEAEARAEAEAEAEAEADEEEDANADVHVFDGPLPETAYVEEGNRWAGDRPVPTAGQALEPAPDEPGGVVVVAEPDAPVEQAAAAGLPVVREPLLDPDKQQDFLSRWSDVQVGFVDDPIGAVRDADALLSEIAAAYSSAFQARRTDLGSWQDDEKPDTESLRLALQRYRSFLGVILPK